MRLFTVCISLVAVVVIVGFTSGEGTHPHSSAMFPCYRLPDTRQYDCWDLEGNVVDCDSAECPGQDGLYYTGCIPGPGMRFLNNGDGTVSDVCTGLMWQRNTADVNGDGQIDQADQLTWCEALQYSEDLEFADYDD